MAPDAVPSPSGAVLVFDGDCGLCTRLADFTRRRVRPDASVVPWQDADLAALGLTEEECLEALQWVDRDGVRAGERAVAATLRAGRPWWRLVGLVLALPPVRVAAGVGYRWVARNRHRLPGGTPACAVPPGTPPADPHA